jgi:putative nucleotidyltransferase with HDIG domain
MQLNTESIPVKIAHFPYIKEMQEVAAERGEDIYLVGGLVRDMLLGRKNKDVDIVVAGSGIAYAESLAQRLGKGAKVSIFKNFGTAQLHYRDLQIEFVGARKESYQQHSRKPEVETGTLEDDLSRRDFTINALAVNMALGKQGEIVDLFDGLADLEAGLIRTPLEPGITFSDDPLRMMRAIRFASQLGFTICKPTLQAIAANKERIGIISFERISDELNKIILSPKPSVGFELLFDTGLLDIIFPELTALHGVRTIENKSHKDNFYHTLQVLDNLSQWSNNLWLRWAAILHDIGKPASQRYDKESGWTFHGHEMIGARMVPKIFNHLKLPLNEKMKYVQKLVMLHLRPIALTQEVTDSAIRRLLVDAGDDIDDLMLLCKADVTSKNKEKVKRIIQHFNAVQQKLEEVEAKDKLRNWKPPITGEIIMDTFKISPSRLVGEIKEEVKEAILNGDIPNEYEPAFLLMLKSGEKHGLVRKD